MKFNLKNRPRHIENTMIVNGTVYDHFPTDLDFKEWFEDFEKEIREEIKGYERVKPARVMEGKDCQKVIIDKLKEILGE